MSLLGKIDSDLKAALISRKEVVVRTLRLLKADIMSEKTRGTEELDDEKIMALILRASKRRKESITEFEKAGRKDLLEKEKEELAVIEEYLPKQLSDKEISQEIEKTMQDFGEVTPKEFGKIMGTVMKNLKGRADGSVVKRILNQKLDN